MCWEGDASLCKVFSSVGISVNDEDKRPCWKAYVFLLAVDYGLFSNGQYNYSYSLTQEAV